MAEPARPKIITEDGEPAVDLDLDDLDAVENEATDEPFTFRAGGQVFYAKSPEDADWQVVADVDQPGGLRGMIRELLGEEQYERFCTGANVTIRQINRVVEGAQKHYGVTAGESKASPRSSSKKRRR